jgi:hypothetical protein
LQGSGGRLGPSGTVKVPSPSEHQTSDRKTAWSVKGHFMGRVAMILMTVMALSAPTHGQHYLPSRPAGGWSVLRRPGVERTVFGRRDHDRPGEPPRRQRSGTYRDGSLLPRFAGASAGGSRDRVGQYVMLDLGPGATSAGNMRGLFYVLDPVKRNLPVRWTVLRETSVQWRRTRWSSSRKGQLQKCLSG